jgi:DNA-binding transcriptional LysR family regulator
VRPNWRKVRRLVVYVMSVLLRTTKLMLRVQHNGTANSPEQYPHLPIQCAMMHDGVMTVRSADDLRIFLAVARLGSLTAAASALRVDHTTIGRRISALERETGRRLFDRRRTGWTLTTDGDRLLDPAERVEAALVAAREAATGNDLAALSGPVRVLATDGFGTFLLAPALGELHEQHPELTIELVTETQPLGTTVRDFDVAITLEQPTGASLVHRKLTDYVLKLYATPHYLATHPPITRIEDLRDHTLVWYVDRLLSIEPLRVLHQVRAEPADIQSTNLVIHWQCAVAGIGVAPLPHYIGASDTRLVNVLPEFELRRTYWVSAPREHAMTARVRAVIALLDGIVARREVDLVGEKRL